MASVAKTRILGQVLSHLGGMTLGKTQLRQVLMIYNIRIIVAKPTHRVLFKTTLKEMMYVNGPYKSQDPI